MTQEISDILAAFSCSPDTPVRSLGEGNINDTYLVEVFPDPFVLQKISKDVFPDPILVIENFKVIHDHFTSKTKGESGGYIMAAPVFTKSGSVMFIDNSGGCWRGQSFIETSTTPALRSQKQARLVGATLASFHNLFKDLNLDKVKDPLPGFHHLSLYLEAYDSHSGNLAQDYSSAFVYCHKTIDKFRQKACTIEKLRQQGELILQPIHGDPKLENFIFDSMGQAIGLLDLDTVGAGLIYHDLGDCLRSACSTSGESAVDTRPPGFDLKRCEWIVEGYFSGDRSNNSDDLRPELIYDGLTAICFELGVRFFTDHLQGNVYFRVEEEGENLIRAKKQFQLFQEIVGQESTIRKRIATICKSV